MLKKKYSYLEDIVCGVDGDLRYNKEAQQITPSRRRLSRYWRESFFYYQINQSPELEVQGCTNEAVATGRGGFSRPSLISRLRFSPLSSYGF